MSKLIVVLGATGLQGGSVVTALLASGAYTIRGVTRDPSSGSAQSLAAKGVQVVPGNLNSVDSLIAAFQGAYAVFGITLPWTPVSETVQGKNMVDACKAVGVELLVWSSLADAKKISGGKYSKVKHWDQKAEVDDYIAKVGQPAVILQTGGFVENMHNLHILRPSGPGKWIIAWPVIRPEVPIPISYIAADFGPCVVKTIELWEKGEGVKLGKEPIAVCSWRMKIEDMVETVRRLSGKEIEYQRPPQMPNEELQEMMLLADEGLNFAGQEFPTPLFLQLGVTFHTFEDYVTKELLPRMEKGPGGA